MKYFFLISPFLLLCIKSFGQVVPISTFISLLGKEIGYIDDQFTKNFRSELGDIDEKNGIVSWKKGFNADHSGNNEFIIYVNLDSIYEFHYYYLTKKTYGPNYSMTIDEYYENELSDSKYKKLDDSIEKDGENKAIVRNYQFEKYLIKKFRFASSNMTLIKFIQQ